jgi:hypothetical protein
MPIGVTPILLGSNQVGGTSGFSVALTTTNFVPAGDRIIIPVTWFANLHNGATANITGGSIFWSTDVTAVSSIDDQFRAAIFSGIAPSGGLAAGSVITGIFSGDSYARSIAGIAFSGIADTSWAEATSTGQSANGTWSSSLSVASNDEVIVAVGWIDKVGTHAPAAGFTEAYEIANTGDTTQSAVIYRYATAGSYSPGGVFTATGIGGSVNCAVAYIAQPPPPLSFDIRLTGGAANTDPRLSIGGAVSSTLAGIDLLDDVAYNEAGAGLTDYRAVYVKNNESADSGSVTAWVSTQLTGGPLIAIGAATQAAGTPPTAIANDTTAPSGVTFSAPTSFGTGVSLGTIGPGQGKGLWIRRTTPLGTLPDPTNAWEVSLRTTPL